MVGNVAVLPIFGVLSQKSSWLTRALGWTATETLERDFREAIANSQVKAIVILRRFAGRHGHRQRRGQQDDCAARGKKPIYAFVRGIAPARPITWPAPRANRRLPLVDDRLDRRRLARTSNTARPWPKWARA
jgi:hypothetical protein